MDERETFWMIDDAADELVLVVPGAASRCLVVLRGAAQVEAMMLSLAQARREMAPAPPAAEVTALLDRLRYVLLAD